MNKLKYQMIIQWSEADSSILYELPEFPSQLWRTHGETYDQAGSNGTEALESLVIAYEAAGDRLPQPTPVCTAA